MQIRTACLSDVDAIYALIQPYIADFIIDDIGRKHFTKQAIELLLQQPDIHYFVAEQQAGVILGIIAYRQPAHLLHFFVNQKHQYQGIGRKLWQFVEKQAMQQPVKEFTVNSSCNAQAVYAHFGFIAVDSVLESRGLRFVPMKKLYTSPNITN